MYKLESGLLVNLEIVNRLLVGSINKENIFPNLTLSHNNTYAVLIFAPVYKIQFIPILGFKNSVIKFPIPRLLNLS